MAKSLRSKLDGILSCPICTETFTDPKTLPCQHSFCHLCLDKYINSLKRNIATQASFECPLCRERVDVPKDGVKSFRNNFLIENLKLIAETDNNGSSDSDIRLTACGFEEDWVAICGTSTCEKHNKRIASFCVDCETYVCTHCIVEGHGTHNLRSYEISEERKKITQKIDGQLVEIRRQISTKSECVNEHLEVIKQLEENHQKTIKEVENRRGDFIKKVNEYCKTLNVSLEQTFNEKREILIRKVDEMNITIGRLDSLADVGRNIVPNEPNDKLRIISRRLQDEQDSTQENTVGNLEGLKMGTLSPSQKCANVFENLIGTISQVYIAQYKSNLSRPFFIPPQRAHVGGTHNASVPPTIATRYTRPASSVQQTQHHPFRRGPATVRAISPMLNDFPRNSVQHSRSSTQPVHTHERQPVTASMLATHPPQEQEQMLGEELFPIIQTWQPELAGKITGMLLELEKGYLLHMLECPEALRAEVDEAVAVLDAHISCVAKARQKKLPRSKRSK